MGYDHERLQALFYTLYCFFNDLKKSTSLLGWARPYIESNSLCLTQGRPIKNEVICLLSKSIFLLIVFPNHHFLDDEGRILFAGALFLLP